MAASMWDPTLRGAFLQRVKKLTADTKPGWGKFHAAAMLAHLNDSYRMCTGELPVKSKNLPLRYTPIKQLVIYVLPFPKGAPTAPELLARGDAAQLTIEQAAFRALATRVAAKPATDSWPDHPAFGTLSHKAWGVLAWRHTDHHLRQFGV